ncbi:MAG: Ig-like domain-containing protein, partial [Bacteroidaceae bacterium]|nr:Ig-like domain-containing protein [Bacteroidaceae bacterium]
DTDTTPKVMSVNIKVKGGSAITSKTMNVGDELELEAAVSVQNGAAQTVTWSSDKEAVATVNNGKVTAVAVGTAVITATSTADATKKAIVTITVIEAGPHPEFLEEGYEYLTAWPAAKIKAFAGIDTPTIELEEGVYFLQDPGDEEEGYAPYVQIVLEGTEDNYYGLCDALDKAGWHYHYDDYYGSEAFIDPTQKVEVDISEVYLDEDYTESAVTYTVYKTEDVWGAKEDTTDTQWSKEVAEVLEAAGINLPFVKLGAEYDIDDSEGIFIYDYSPDFNKLNNYGATLKAAGFAEEGSEQEGYYYTIDKDEYSFFVVEFGFTGYGNTIMVSEYLTELKAFPAEGVAAYLTDHESVTTLPAFTGSDKLAYTFTRYSDEKNEDVEFAQVGLYGATEAECEAYVLGLVNAGFATVEADEEEEIPDGYAVVCVQKGKLVVEAVMSYWRSMTEEEIEDYMDQDVDAMTDEEYEEFYTNLMMYMFTGSIDVLDDEMQEAWLTLSIDETAREVPGLYFNGKSLKVKPEADVTLEVEAFQLGDAPTLTYTSSNEAIATVSAAGVVHGVAVGECKITVETTVNEQNYSVEVPVIVNTVEEKVLTIDADKLGVKGSYADSLGDHQIAIGESQVTINTTDVCKQSGIQFKKGTGILSTKTEFVGEIVSIVLPVDTLKVYIGVDQASQQLIEPVAVEGGFSYAAPAGAKFFTLKNEGSKAVNVATIVINYLA